MDKQIGILVDMPESHPLHFEDQYRSERRVAIIETHLTKINNLVSLNRYREAHHEALKIIDRLREWE